MAIAMSWWQGNCYFNGSTQEHVVIPSPAVLAARQSWYANGWPDAEGELCLAEQVVLDGISKVYDPYLSLDTRRIDDSNLPWCLQHAIERRRGG